LAASTAGLAVALLAVLFWPSSPSATPTGNDAASVATASAGPGTRDVTINFVLNDSDTARAGCIGQGGYSDIGPGTPVTLKNASGTILGAASLGSGSASTGTCLWSVTLRDVPLDEDFYSAEVADRGAITHSLAELRSNNYQFDVSLG
jgi:hypothetical protein